MTISYIQFFAPTVLGTSAAALYTLPGSPASTLLRGGRVRFTNTSASARTVTAYAVPAVGTPGAGNAFLWQATIGVGGYLDVDVPIMGPGMSLQALADAAASVTAHMIGGGVYA